jgi:DNA polymerase III subunit chi
MYAFYHTSGDTPAAVDAALPQLLSKAREAGHKLAIVCPTPERLHRLDEALWSYAESSFLPHSPLEDATPAIDKHPILLLTPEEATENPAAFTGRIPVLLAGTEGAQPLLPESAERVLYLFHNNPDVVAGARSFFKTVKSASSSAPAYWQQSSAGKWEKKA